MKYLSLVIFSVFFGRAFAGELPPKEVLANELEQYNYFANSPAMFATVCFADDCESAAVGYTNFDRTQKVDLKSLTSIGSNSKFMTAILTLMMVDQGFLKLEDRLDDYFPEYAHWKGVTIRDLLQHSSGVPPYLFSQAGLARTTLSLLNWRTRIWNPHELVAIVAKQPSIFEAGTKIEYNNTNYVLLGMVLEKATHRPLEVLFETELFLPLGMRDTYLTLMDSEKYRRVSGYFPLNINIPDWVVNIFSSKVEKTGTYVDTTKAFDSSMTWAAGGMVSTTADLAKVIRALFSGHLLSESMFAEMKTFREGQVLGFPLVYGLGLMKLPSAHGELLGHGGMTPGYQSVSNYLPSQDMILTLAQNLAPSQTYSIYFDLLDLVNTGFPSKNFIEEDGVRVDQLSDNAVHLRVRGKILDPLNKQPIFFPRSFGYAQEKGNKGAKEPFQAFDSHLVVKDGRSLLVLTGMAGSNPFGGKPKGVVKTPFLEVSFDKENLLARNAHRFRNGDGDDLLFAYKGIATIDPNGDRSVCVLEVIDRSRPASFQIDGQKDESLELGQTVKFVGNIPFKKAKKEELPMEITGKDRVLCK